MQLYGHGLRRRTAAMLGGDGPRLRMAWSLMLSLPGTPVIFMGDEIGMGENLSIPDRMSVRVPMQWSDARNGGFSSAPRGELVRPMRERPLRPEERERGRPAPRRRLAAELPGAADPPPQGDPGVRLGVEHADRDNARASCSRIAVTGRARRVAAVHNLSATKARATLDLGIPKGERVAIDDLLEQREHTPNADGTLDVELDGYGYLWLRVRRAGERPLT